ncbi:MAG: RNA polymerase sigma factor, partial [Armatimonadetes bacterium]|nr:RNA polymerase sigma factor [Armatimonadota bacterium]
MVAASASCTQSRCTACLALVGRLKANTCGVHDVDDCVQELFARLWRDGAWAVPTHRGCQECLRFVGVVARRHAISWQRHWTRTLAREVPFGAIGDDAALAAREPTQADVAEEAMLHLLTSSIEEHLKTLTAWQQTVILLRFRDGLSAADIARRTDASADAVRQALRRALVALRAALHADAPPPKPRAASARQVAHPQAIPRSAPLNVTLWCARAI